jgi:16S rRNA (uracil1498-N3)-methyltransferase
MASPRFYLPPDQVEGKILSLPEREVHHARDVLRVRTGQQITLLDGQGNRFICEVTSVGRHTLEATILSKEHTPPVPWQISLLQAVTKTKSMETIIQKATELGAARIVPVLTERVAVKLDPERPKPDKWRGIAIDAMKQCSGAWLPLVDDPISLGDYLARNDSFDLALLASLESVRHPRELFHAFESEHKHPPRTLAVWIGPEGDFTAAELAAIQASSAQPISLGPQILRAETAALYCLSIVNYELQARWKPHAEETMARIPH